MDTILHGVHILKYSIPHHTLMGTKFGVELPSTPSFALLGKFRPP